VRSHLDPESDGLLFTGFGLAPDWAGRSHALALARHVDAYEDLGVRYVLTPVGYNPFLEPATPPRPETPPSAKFLAAGEHETGEISGRFVRAGQIAAFAATVATFHGTADGALSIHICLPSACADGVGNLRRAADNEPFPIALDRPLDVATGQTLHYDLTRLGGVSPLAIYRWHYANGEATEVSLVHVIAQHVFRGQMTDIYQLPNPHSYFEARGAVCSLSVINRQSVVASCAGPAVLVRRELFDAGWRADVNGQPAAVSATDGILQSVALPTGECRVRFEFVPAFSGWCYAAAAVGLGWLLTRLLLGVLG
jgi:hypothetical protein